MAKEWSLAGKTLKDFSSKIDYTVESKEDRLEIVRQALGEQPILHNGETLIEEYEVKSSIVVEDWSKRDRDYDFETKTKTMNKYDDFFPEYFSSTPKFSMDRVEKFESKLAQKRAEIEEGMSTFREQMQQYDEAIERYYALIDKGEQATKPKKPKMPKISAKDLQSEKSISRLKELLVKENCMELTSDDILELRALKKFWMYNGDREVTKGHKNEYNYTNLERKIQEFLDKELRDENEDKQLIEMLELQQLVDMDSKTKEQNNRMRNLSKKYADLKQVEIKSQHKNNTKFLNYTPHAGTSNAENMNKPNPNLKPLSENDWTCKTLQAMGTYLIGKADNVYPPEKQLSPVKKDAEPKPKRGIFKSRKFKVLKIEGLHENKEYEKGKHISKFPTFLIIDRSASREEIENLMSKQIYQYQQLKKEVEEKKEAVGLTKEEAKFYNKFYKEINEDAMEIMHSKHRYINMRALMKPSTVINYDEDTGYIDENGEYKHISYNGISFTDPKHIAGFVSKYKSIKDFSENREHALFYHMELFHELFNKIVDQLSHEEKQILEWFMQDEIQIDSEDEETETILKRFEEKFGDTISKPSVSKLIHKKVPKLMAEQYNNELEEYVYTYKIKGNYHTCSKCQTPKLAISKYFGKDKRNKNGLKSICKVCDKSKK